MPFRLSDWYQRHHWMSHSVMWCDDSITVTLTILWLVWIWAIQEMPLLLLFLLLLGFIYFMSNMWEYRQCSHAWKLMHKLCMTAVVWCGFYSLFFSCKIFELYYVVSLSIFDPYCLPHTDMYQLRHQCTVAAGDNVSLYETWFELWWMLCDVVTCRPKLTVYR